MGKENKEMLETWKADDKYVMRDGVQIGSFITAGLAAQAVAGHGNADRFRAALEAITHIAGNLTDEAVEAVGGVNDARSRALMVVTARQIAQNALRKAAIPE